MALTNETAIRAAGDAIQIDSSNNVGIGVSPSYKFHVSGAIYEELRDVLPELTTNEGGARARRRGLTLC